MCSILLPSGYVRVIQLVCSILLPSRYMGAAYVLKIRNSNQVMHSLDVCAIQCKVVLFVFELVC